MFGCIFFFLFGTLNPSRTIPSSNSAESDKLPSPRVQRQAFVSRDRDSRIDSMKCRLFSSEFLFGSLKFFGRNGKMRRKRQNLFFCFEMTEMGQSDDVDSSCHV